MAGTTPQPSHEPPRKGAGTRHYTNLSVERRTGGRVGRNLLSETLSKQCWLRILMLSKTITWAKPSTAAHPPPTNHWPTALRGGTIWEFTKHWLTKSFVQLGRVGLDLIEGKVCDNKKAGVLEPSISKIKCLKFATEAAITILRIDDMIKLRPEKKEESAYGQAMQRGDL